MLLNKDSVKDCWQTRLVKVWYAVQPALMRGPGSAALHVHPEPGLKLHTGHEARCMRLTVGRCALRSSTRETGQEFIEFIVL